MSMKIDIYEFVSMTGLIGSYGYTLQELTRSGIDGHDFLKLGKRGVPFQISTISMHSGLTSAQQAVFDYESLKSQTVIIKKGFEEYSNVIVRDAKSTIAEVGISTDGNSHKVDTVWLLQRIGD